MVIIHPSSCELSLNNELATYVVLSLRGIGVLQAAAGSVSRHLPSLHVDPGICRLVRWLSHVWLSSSILDLCRLPGGPSEGSADVSYYPGFPWRLFTHIQQQPLWKALYLPIWIVLCHLREGKAAVDPAHQHTNSCWKSNKEALGIWLVSRSICLSHPAYWTAHKWLRTELKQHVHFERQVLILDIQSYHRSLLLHV